MNPAAWRRLLTWTMCVLAATGPGSMLSARVGPGVPIERTRDCADCPTMIFVPGGRFTIGSPDAEPGRHSNEGPRRPVDIASLAVSETEITRGQFRAFLRATGRRPEPGCDTHGDGTDGNWDHVPTASWSAPGFAQTDEHPVVCITWQEAADYAAWLAARTGRHYRLLGEAEWEYAARAGTGTAFYWGDDEDAACAYANGGDRSLVRALPTWAIAIRAAQAAAEAGARILACDDHAGFTRPAGRYRANGFGLRDMTGNVWEWVADCFQAGGYGDQPARGQALARIACDRHRARGGSWDDYPIDLRSARRTSGLEPSSRRNDTGFRIARDVERAR